MAVNRLPWEIWLNCALLGQPNTRMKDYFQGIFEDMEPTTRLELVICLFQNMGSTFILLILNEPLPSTLLKMSSKWRRDGAQAALNSDFMRVEVN